MEDKFFDQYRLISNNVNNHLHNLAKQHKKPGIKAGIKNKPQRPLPAQKPVKKIVNLEPQTPLMKKIMRGKELDTKIKVLRSQGKKPSEFVDLLDEFQKNSMDLENDN
jgi:hypothetical protein